MTTAGAAGRRQLTLELAAEHVPQAEALLMLAGAETIALEDAADDPVFEPEPSTTPLWPTVTLHAVFGGDADLAPLRDLLAATFPNTSVVVEALPDAAWRPGLARGVRARPIGARLWLAPADEPHVPAGRIVVRIHMGLAFGTGEHPTTALCLDWLERHVTSGSTLLDYGCGTGVLGLAALVLGAHGALAVDNDEQALLATRANAELNGLTERLLVCSPEELPATQVDVLAANILAGPLVELATRFAAHVRPGGLVVLSGVLEAQAARVAAAYAPYFDELEHASRDGWVRLTGRRNAVNGGENR